MTSRISTRRPAVSVIGADSRPAGSLEGRFYELAHIMPKTQRGMESR